MSEQLTHAIAGAGGGALAAVVTYPLITLSTRAQTAAKHDHEGTIPAIRKVVEKEGVGALYAGLDSALWGMTVTNFVYYYFYEGIRAVYLEKAPSLTTAQSMLTGTYAGVATSIITNPIWVVNTRTMVGATRQPTWQTIRDIWRHDGPLAFFSGVGPALLLVVNPVLQYTIFEQLKTVVESRRGRRIGSLDAFVLGALGKIVATTATYPLITIKARLQARRQRDEKSTQQPLLERLAKVWHTLSFSDLYRGWSLKVLQSALQSAFLFLFKEQLFELALVLIRVIKGKRARRLI